MHFPRLECRTDATHVVRCLLGTGVRLLNWALAASAGVSAMCLAFGVSRNVLVCRLFEARCCRRLYSEAKTDLLNVHSVLLKWALAVGAYVCVERPAFGVSRYVLSCRPALRMRQGSYRSCACCLQRMAFPCDVHNTECLRRAPCSVVFFPCILHRVRLLNLTAECHRAVLLCTSSSSKRLAD